MGDLGKRNPVTLDEWPFLVSLGTSLSDLRRRAGLSQAALADRAELSPKALGRIERARRRTRRSTLARIAAALVAANPKLGSADILVDHLADLAGPAVAPESEFRERVERRRVRRYRSRANKGAHAARLEQASAGPGPRALVRLAKRAADDNDPAAFEAVLHQIESAK